jgi:hypothetical protein
MNALARLTIAEDQDAAVWFRSARNAFLTIIHTAGICAQNQKLKARNRMPERSELQATGQTWDEALKEKVGK